MNRYTLQVAPEILNQTTLFREDDLSPEVMKIRNSEVTMNDTHRIRLILVWLCAFGGWGCAHQSELSHDHEQAALGMGIVVGTRGYQELQQALAQPDGSAQAVEGQVTKIEGAAYLIKDMTGNVLRLPLDQNTTIDRPAHVGDWIKAYLDNHGRAIFIRNIDEELPKKEAE